MPYTAQQSRYETMPYRRAGRSGVMLPAVSLGLWQNFGGVNTYETSRAILRYAFDNGINHFDLANNYGPPPGTAEETFGRVMAEDFRPYRDEMIISTKAGYYMWPGPYGDGGSKKYLISSLDQSLKRMGLDYVDIFYHHRFDKDTPIEETADALAQIVHSGKALYVGVSNYNSECSRAMSELLSQRGVRCLLNQPCYNIMNRYTEDDGLYEELDSLGMGSIVFSPLAQGLLTDRYISGIPSDSRAARNWFLKEKDITKEKIEQVSALNKIAVSRGQTLAQMAIAWVLRDGHATSALVGASSVEQLRDNIESVKTLAFTHDELDMIDKIIIRV